MAQNQALQAAELVEQQRAAAEKNALARDLGQQRAATAVDVAQTRAQGAVETQQVRNEGTTQRVKLTAQERRGLNEQSHTLEMEEQKAAREGRYQDATNLQKQRQQASAAAAEANRQFNERQQQQRLAHQKLLQDERLKRGSTKITPQQRAKMDVIAKRIDGLQRLLPKATTTPVQGKKTKDEIEDEIESLLDAYEREAVGSPAATTQPAAGERVQIATAAEYAALPSGTKYVDPKGVRRTKQ